MFNKILLKRLRNGGKVNKVKDLNFNMNFFLIFENINLLYSLNDVKEYNFSSIKNKNFKKHLLTNFRFIFLGGVYYSYFYTNIYLYNFFFFLQNWFSFEFMFLIIFLQKLLNFIILFYYGNIKSNS